MYHVIPGTIEEIRAMTLFRKADWSAVPMPVVGKAISAYRSSKGSNMVTAESEAVKFYLFNHLSSLLAMEYKSQEPVAKEDYAMLRRCLEVESDIATRLLYYVILITTRESRHVLNKHGVYATLLPGVLGDYSSLFREFHSTHVLDDNSMLSVLKSNAPVMPLGLYMKAMEHIFYHGGFHSSYGGPPWGAIAKAGRKVIHGETSFELFADMAFALGHNGGPMFDKGMLYHGYDKTLLLKILDLQRAGSLPKWLVSGTGVPSGVSHDAAVNEALAFGKKRFGAVFAGTVDWKEVKRLGAVGDYDEDDAPKGNAVPESKKFYVMPGIYAVKTERMAA